jgi:hypothetical protein
VALLLEVGVTIADFVVEDRTRRLPAFERVLHTVLTLLFGVLLMAIAPVLMDWWTLPADVVAIDYGGFSVLLALFAVGMTVWGVRDAVAALSHFRPAEWLRDPIEEARRRLPARCFRHRRDWFHRWPRVRIAAQSAATPCGSGRAMPTARWRASDLTCTW